MRETGANWCDTGLGDITLAGGYSVRIFDRADGSLAGYLRRDGSVEAVIVRCSAAAIAAAAWKLVR